MRLERLIQEGETEKEELQELSLGSIAVVRGVDEPKSAKQREDAK